MDRWKPGLSPRPRLLLDSHNATSEIRQSSRLVSAGYFVVDVCVVFRGFDLSVGRIGEFVVMPARRIDDARL
jgi:hypothetical protein